MKVSANGGTAEPNTTLREGDEGHWWPQFLPGGKALVFTLVTRDGHQPAVLTLETGDYRVLSELGQGRTVRYVPTGHLVFVEQNTLFAAPFDAVRLVVTGPPVPVIEDIHVWSTSRLAYYATSATGTLVYMENKDHASERRLLRIDRQERSVPRCRGRGRFHQPAFFSRRLEALGR